MILLSVPDTGCHLGTQCLTPQDHLCIHSRSCSVSGGLVVHYELLPMGKTITADLYSLQLKPVQQALKQKEPALVNHKGVLFLQDNARLHLVFHCFHHGL